MAAFKLDVRLLLPSLPPSCHGLAVKKKSTGKKRHGEIYVLSGGLGLHSMIHSDQDLGVYFRAARWISIVFNPFIDLQRIIYAELAENVSQDDTDG
jgi:hypothetical protein